MQLSPFDEVSACEARLIPSQQRLSRRRIRASQKNDLGRRRRQCHGIRPLTQRFTSSPQIGPRGQCTAVEQEHSPVSARGHRFRARCGYNETR